MSAVSQPAGLRSALFHDDEPVFTAYPHLLTDVAVPVFGKTDLWLLDCVRRPSNRAKSAWKLLLPQSDPAWNLRIREFAFISWNPTHRAVRRAGLHLRADPDDIGTVLVHAFRLKRLARWAEKGGMPAALGSWVAEDWQGFLDDLGDSVAPRTAEHYELAIRKLHTYAVALTCGGLRTDPFERRGAAQQSRRSVVQELSTPPIPPQAWWALLHDAWTYIHVFAPDVLTLRDELMRHPTRLGTPKPSRPPRHYTPSEEINAAVRSWLDDPAHRVPVHARTWRGGVPGEPVWGTLSLMISDGQGRGLFGHSAKLTTDQAARRAWVRSVVGEGRVEPVDGFTGIMVTGIRYQSSAGNRSTSELDETLVRWLADPAHLIPVREVRDARTGAPAGDPVWDAVERLVYGHGRRNIFLPLHAAGRRRRDAVCAAVAEGRVQVMGGNADFPDYRFACPGFSTVSRPDGACGPWRTEISLTELKHELRMVRAACYIFVVALTMMRDSEIQEIQRGALATHYGSPSIKSRKIKPDPVEPELHWWIIEPVAEAIAAAERLSPHETHLFVTTGRARELLDSPEFVSRGIRAADDIDYFIAGVNSDLEATGLRPIPETHIRPHMFRRTMAIIAGQEPDGEIALGLQLKHAARRALANRVTSSYAQIHPSWVAEFDTQLELAAARKLIDLFKGRRGGETVAVGPGATRLHDGLDKVIAKVEQASDLQAQFGDERLLVTLLRDEFADLHWGTLNHCLWDPARAECQNGLPDDQRGQGPVLGACQPARCRNSVVTAKHAPVWLAEEKDLLKMLRAPRLASCRKESLQNRLTEVRLITHSIPIGGD